MAGVEPTHGELVHALSAHVLLAALVRIRALSADIGIRAGIAVGAGTGRRGETVYSAEEAVIAAAVTIIVQS